MTALLLTRETDYALRVLRGLMDGEQRAVGELSQKQMIPQQFAYKIVKKLSRAGLVQVSRGADGGCRLRADLNKVSLYDLMVIMEARSDVNACMDPGFTCPWREQNGGCGVHDRLCNIQQRMDDELRACNLMSLLTGE